MLCGVCQDTIERAVRDLRQLEALPDSGFYDPYRKHHRSLRSLWESLFTDCYICNTFCERISPWARALILERLDTPSALGFDGAELGEGDWRPLVTGFEFRPSGYFEVAGKSRARGFWLTVRLEEDHINFGSTITDDASQEVEVPFILDGEKISHRHRNRWPVHSSSES